ncbi:hypothetical protein RO3G_08813 [Rhizopus delemar RA 99-880]|uniref:Uncharacterized protein n=1 Tax=Rhizopus delemar (strain RA 99-880 / ATCC MYA-4621 / FGSC 9543 / NRRL 43880) TaxID=246409 RepID=I1C6M3_RHIO9|nr:hypothetical protein RO3G_08813 [Rhizopus delemar RA 99-880]|eukprot:EIE84103.1 hypothetical protein RO3G_08813 [Rhizopus delemar RA 99-880]
MDHDKNSCSGNSSSLVLVENATHILTASRFMSTAGAYFSLTVEEIQPVFHAQCFVFSTTLVLPLQTTSLLFSKHQHKPSLVKILVDIHLLITYSIACPWQLEQKE